MSSSTTPQTALIDRLRARLERLASEPRVLLVPDGRAIVAELAALVDLVGGLNARVECIEAALVLAGYQEGRCDET